MMENIDLKRMERKAYMSYHQDGLWDLFLGSLIIIWGVSMATSMASLGGVWFVVLLPILVAAKKRITYPRLGYAQFPRGRKARRQMVILLTITMLMGLLVLVLFLTGGPFWLREWLRRYFQVFFGGLMAVVLGCVAAFQAIKRLYLYAVMIFVSFALAQWLGFHMQFSFIAAGAVILLSGLALLIRFLRRYQPGATKMSPGENVTA